MSKKRLSAATYQKRRLDLWHAIGGKEIEVMELEEKLRQLNAEIKSMKKLSRTLSLEEQGKI